MIKVMGTEGEMELKTEDVELGHVVTAHELDILKNDGLSSYCRDDPLLDSKDKIEKDQILLQHRINRLQYIKKFIDLRIEDSKKEEK